MTVLSTTPLSADAIKVRAKEPYVTSALNQKTLSTQPKGVMTGFGVIPSGLFAGFGVRLTTDATGLSVANVRETTGGLFSVTLVLNSFVDLDLTGQAGQTVFIVLDAQYAVGATSAAQIKVVNAAEIGLTGVGDSFSGAAPNMVLTDAAALFTANMVGAYVTISGATSPANNGTFLITAYGAPSNITFTNPSGVVEAFTGTWNIVVNKDLVLLAKVNVPGIAPILASHINLGWRDASGDFLPVEYSAHINLVHNSSFEATAAGWTNNGFDSVTASTDYAQSGGYSLKLVKGVAGTVDAVTGPMPVVPGRNYRVKAWLRSPAGLTGGNGAKLQVAFYDAVGAQIGAWADVEAAIGSGTMAFFVERRIEAIAPTLALTAQIRVLFDNCSGTLYVDSPEFATHAHDEMMKSAVFGGPGVSADGYHTHTGAGLAYGGGVAWADATPNPATTVEAQLDKILSDLAGASGAPKIGNAPSKILTNTFTQLNTFNNGISVGNGIAATTGDLTFSTAAQKVNWPSSVFIDSNAASTLTFNLNALGGTALLNDTGAFNQFLMNNSLGGFGTLLSIRNFDTKIEILSTQNVPMEFSTNSSPRWRIAGTGQLQAIGGNRAIQNVLDPVAAQDAATKLYVDTRTNSVNVCHNGNMGIWARGRSAVTGSGNALGYSAKLRRADRFYALMRTDSVGGIFGSNDFRLERVPYAGTTGTGVSFAGPAPNMVLTSAGGFTANMVGKFVTISGATTGTNNGTFPITAYGGATSITYTNASGVAEAFPGTWQVVVNTQTANASRVTFLSKKVGPNPSGFVELVQELDRDMVRLARGKKLTIAFRWAKGPAYTSTGLIEVVASTGNSFRNLATYNGSNSIIGSEFVGAGSIPTSLDAGFKVFVTSSIVPENCNALSFYIAREMTGATGVNDWLDVTDVIVLIGDKTVSYVPPSEYPLAGGSYEGEIALCQRFYENTALLGDTGGVGLPEFGTPSAGYSLSQSSASMFDRYCPVRFLVQKRADYNNLLATLKVHALDGTADTVYDAVFGGNVGVNYGFSGGQEHEMFVNVSTSADRACFFQWAYDADFI